MSTADKPPVLVPEPVSEKAAPASNGKTFATREDFLAAVGKLAEEEVFVEGVGWLLCSEITGDARADIVGKSATSLNNGNLDVKSYQRALLLAGLVDPSSPKGERRPLFRPGDIDRVMLVGGRQILAAIDVIEKLSAMGRYQDAAEGNSVDTPSDGSTSG